MKQQIDDVIHQINKKWGYQTVLKAREVTSDIPGIRTGFKTLDKLIACIPRSAITALSGRPTSGVTTMAHTIVATAQASGENAIYIQFDNTLDASYAAACGIKVDQMLSVEVETLPAALAVLREIVSSPVVGLIVLNLLPIESRQLALRSTLHDIRRSNSVVLFLVRPELSSSNFDIRLDIERQDWLYRDEHISGCISSVAITQKSRFGTNHHHVALPIPIMHEVHV